MTKQVVIVGAGLAGLSCAVELLEKGIKPIVLESKPFVGGRTASWDDNGMHIESGLHRYLGFYRHMPKLLRKAGLKVRDVIFWEDAVEMRFPHGPNAVYHASVHRPFRTLRSLIFNGHYLSFVDKLQLTRMFTAGIKDYFLRPKSLENITVDDYAKKHKVGQRAHDRLLVPATAGIFFISPDKYAAYNLFGLVAPFIPHLWRFRIGGFRGGMTEVMANPIADYVRQNGGQVEVNSKVKKLIVRNDEVAGVQLTSGRKIYADWIVLACSLAEAQRLTSEYFSNNDWCKEWLKLESIPVVTLQIELKKPSMRYDRTTFGPLTSMASFAEQSRTTFAQSHGRISIILSPPSEFINTPVKDLQTMAVEQLKKLNIDISGQIKDARKVLLPMDFYSLAINSESLRPAQETPVTGLTLAGDYTKQRYLGTMEGAVYSGKLASKIVSRKLKLG